MGAGLRALLPPPRSTRGQTIHAASTSPSPRPAHQRRRTHGRRLRRGRTLSDSRLAPAPGAANKLEQLNRSAATWKPPRLTTIEGRLAADAEISADRLLVSTATAGIAASSASSPSRVVERTAKPALVISIEDGPNGRIAHGSGRSVDGFMLLAAIESAPIFLRRFGGHAFAVGFALPAEKLPELKRRLRIYAEEHLPAREPDAFCVFTPSCRSTASRRCSPDGSKNSSRSPRPIPSRFSFARNARLVKAPRIMKARHLSLELRAGLIAPPKGASTSLPTSFPAGSPGSPGPSAPFRAVGLEPCRPRHGAPSRARQPHRRCLSYPRKTTTPTSAASKSRSWAWKRRRPTPE